MTPNAPVVTIVSAITAAITSTLGLLSFAGVDQDLVGALQVAAGGWIVVGAMLIHARTTPTSEVALTRDELEELEAGDRGAVDIGTVLVLVVLVVLILILVGRV